jgi:entericidin B
MRWQSIFLVLTIIPVMLTLSACHTVRGVGEDIESGGQALQRTSKH